MAARNLKSQPSTLAGSFEQVEKTSSTLKRHPKMELSKADLLHLLGLLEGELQAREIVIAVLKAEQVKQLLYPKRKSSSPNDPWAALQRDCLGAFDASFDEAAVKNLYGMQLTQLEHFLKQYKLAQTKLKQQLQDAEQRCEKLLSELEEEKQKHAQDTAQGDDVTYLLEKERERLHQENQFERQQNKCMEKSIKCLTDTLEQERQRQKQIVLLLLAERKKLIFHYAEEKQKCDRLSQILCDEKGRIADMVDGLEEESKKSLQMEAELERQLCEFEVEREQYKSEMTELESKNNELTLEVQKLQEELESLQKQMAQSSLNTQAQLGEGVRSAIVTVVSTPPIRAVPTISPTISPPRGVARAVSPKLGPAPATPAKPPGLLPQTPGKICPAAISKPAVTFPASAVSQSTNCSIQAPQNMKKPIKLEPTSVTSPVPDESSTVSTLSQFAETTLSPDTEKGIANDLSSQTNSKIYSSVKVPSAVSVHKPALATTPGSGTVKKPSVGRGVPPPIPPNKPVLTGQILHKKDSGPKPPVPPRSDVSSENIADKNVQRVATLPRFSHPVKTEDSSVVPQSEKDDIQVGVCNETFNSSKINSTDKNIESDVLGQELADFHQIFISMGNKSNSVNSSE